MKEHINHKIFKYIAINSLQNSFLAYNVINVKHAIGVSLTSEYKEGDIMMNHDVKTSNGNVAVYQKQGGMQQFFSGAGLAELAVGTVLGLAICLAAGTSADAFAGPSLIMSVLIALLMFR
jgi:hypothetical protein